MDLETLMQNEEFNARMEACKTVEEAAEIMREYGLEVTAEQLKAALRAEKESELDETQLENVAGGIILPWLPWFPRRPLPLPRPRWPWLVLM